MHVGFIEAKNRRAIEGNAIHELQEGALNIFERGILVEMFAVNGGDHSDDRREHEEGAVAFIGFDDEIVAAAYARGAAHVVDLAADDKGGIEICSRQNRGDHRSSGGFAVGAGYRDAVFQAHQFG